MVKYTARYKEDKKMYKITFMSFILTFDADAWYNNSKLTYSRREFYRFHPSTVKCNNGFKFLSISLICCVAADAFLDDVCKNTKKHVTQLQAAMLRKLSPIL